MKPRVSLCMIVRNEAANLADCLATVMDLVDEIVIVDTGSVDSTKDIALAHGARVFDFPWCDDFAASRNESLRHATGKWILWLDADDRLPESSRDALRTLLASLHDETIAYNMRVVSVGPDGQPAHEAAHVRLFTNNPRVRWQYRVHEQIIPALVKDGTRARDTGVVVVHVGYMRSGAVTAKLERNLRLLDRGLESSPYDGHLLSYRAGCLVDLCRAAEALVTIGFWESAHSQYRMPQQLRVLKVRALAMEADLCGAMECVRQGIDDYPGDSKLMFMESEILAAMGHLQAAERGLRFLLEVGEEHQRNGIADRTVASFRAGYLLAEVLLAQGRMSDAASEARAVTGERPAFGNAWLTLGEAADVLGDRETAEEVCAHFRSKVGPDATVAMKVLRATELRHAGDPEGALAAIGDLGDHPAVTPIRVQILGELPDRRGELSTAICNALRADPLNLRVWSVQRKHVPLAMEGLPVPMVAQQGTHGL
jgi:hypothetical protein